MLLAGATGHCSLVSANSSTHSLHAKHSACLKYSRQSRASCQSLRVGQMRSLISRQGGLQHLPQVLQALCDQALPGLPGLLQVVVAQTL